MNVLKVNLPKHPREVTLVFFYTVLAGYKSGQTQTSCIWELIWLTGYFLQAVQAEEQPPDLCGCCFQAAVEHDAGLQRHGPVNGKHDLWMGQRGKPCVCVRERKRVIVEDCDCKYVLFQTQVTNHFFIEHRGKKNTLSALNGKTDL